MLLLLQPAAPGVASKKKGGGGQGLHRQCMTIAFLMQGLHRQCMTIAFLMLTLRHLQSVHLYPFACGHAVAAPIRAPISLRLWSHCGTSAPCTCIPFPLWSRCGSPNHLLYARIPGRVPSLTYGCDSRRGAHMPAPAT